MERKKKEKDIFINKYQHDETLYLGLKTTISLLTSEQKFAWSFSLHLQIAFRIDFEVTLSWQIIVQTYGIRMNMMP